VRDGAGFRRILIAALALVAARHIAAQNLNLYSAKDKVVAKTITIFGYHDPVQIRITSGFGSVEDTSQPFSPALICDDDIIKHFTLDCYQARTKKDTYFDDPHVQFVSISDSHQAVLFSANSNYSGSGWTWLWSLLTLTHDGHWKNLFPEVTSSNQSEYLFWSSPALSSYKIFTVADFIWAEGETHFSSHRYQITSYEYCAPASKYVVGDRFITKSKFPGLDDVEHLNVIRPEMAEIQGRLKEKAAAACR
jgi:hypothetical protein